MSLVPGSKFHDLTLVQHCGTGAYGDVWLCRDITGKTIALKLIAKARQPAELKGVAALRSKLPGHPNILSIHYIGEDDEFLWYTMDAADNLTPDGPEYVPDTLDNRIRRKIPSDPVAVMRDLLSGLGALHAADMVHRDIKPANILFIHGRAVLGDIGMVASDTTSLSLAGTLGFLPPEVRDGSSSPGTVGKAGDVYALGKVLYCMITGNPPEEFPDLPTNLPSTPLIRRLNRLACRTCEQHPGERLKDLSGISAELEKAVALGNTPERLLERILLWKKIMIRTGAALLILLILAIAGYFAFPSLQPVLRKVLVKPVYPGMEKFVEYHHSRLPISMKIPSDWVIMNEETAKKIFAKADTQTMFEKKGFTSAAAAYFEQMVKNGMDMLICHVGSSYSENIIINSIRFPQEDIQEFEKLSENELTVRMVILMRQMYAPSTIVYSVRKSTIAGYPAIAIEFSVTPAELRQKMYVISPPGGTQYQITYHARKENYSTYLGAVDAAVKTLKIGK